MKIQLFDFSVNIMRSLLWRHNKAVNLETLIKNKQIAFDKLHQDFWESWYHDVFNLDTANRFGMAVWAIILNIPLTIVGVDPEPANSNFGFGEYRKNFNNGNFTAIGGTSGLTLEDIRKVLKLRYYQLVTRGTVYECNKIINDVFAPIKGYVSDNYDMTMRYTFDSYLHPTLRSVIEKYDLLPRPSAVKVDIVYQQDLNSNFGFGEYRKNFDNGNFQEEI